MNKSVYQNISDFFLLMILMENLYFPAGLGTSFSYHGDGQNLEVVMKRKMMKTSSAGPQVVPSCACSALWWPRGKMSPESSRNRTQWWQRGACPHMGWVGAGGAVNTERKNPPSTRDTPCPALTPLGWNNAPLSSHVLKRFSVLWRSCSQSAQSSTPPPAGRLQPQHEGNQPEQETTNRRNVKYSLWSGWI